MAERVGIRGLAKQGYWREGQARLVMKAWRRSGETLAEFCRKQRIQRRRLERWARRLRGSGEGIRFHRARLVERRSAAQEPVGGAAGAPIEIEWGVGRRVRVFSGFLAEDLGRVLEVLEGRSRC
jgi:hypothetical protein